MIDVGVIGAGNHSSRNHGPAIERIAGRHEDIVRAAVCDLDAERADRYATEFGFARTYTDIEAMLDREDIDALVAVTPQSRTAAIVADLLPQGIPLLLEKPPGQTSAETAELVAIADDTGTDHMISLNRRFSPAVHRAGAWIDEGGREPQHVVSTMRRVDRLEAGFLVETGIHLVDLQHAFLGRPAAVTSATWHTRPTNGEAASARVEYASGARGTITIIPDAGSVEERHELVGPGWSLEIDVGGCSFAAFVDGELVTDWEHDEVPGYERNGALAETDAFLAAVRGDRSFAPDLRDGYGSMRLAEAIADGETTKIEAVS